MAVPLLDLSTVNVALLPEMRSTFEDIVASGQFVLGPHVDRFEKQLAALCGTVGAVGVSSGTDALLMSLMALGVGPGDEVITSPLTFFATTGCIVRLGATPVFVDVDPVTFNIDPDLIESAVTARTKAVIPVHLYGQAADMEPITAVARRHGVWVVEDAAQAIGASDHGRMVGSWGDVACFSFYPTKNLSALGDAGACTTNDPQLAQRLVMLRVHGQDSRYHHALVGGNFRIDALQAAMLNVKLPHLDGWNQERRVIARRYHELLGGLPLTLPHEAAGKVHVYHQYTIRVTGGKRDDLGRHLNGRGIGHAIYYPTPLHLQPCLASLGGRMGGLPVAEAAAREVISLPLYPGLSQDQQNEVAAAVRAFFAQ